MWMQQGRTLQPGWSLAPGWGGFLIAGLLALSLFPKMHFPPCTGLRCRKRWCTIGTPSLSGPSLQTPGFAGGCCSPRMQVSFPFATSTKPFWNQRHRPTAVMQNPAGARGYFSLPFPHPVVSLSAPNSAQSPASRPHPGSRLLAQPLCLPCRHVLCLPGSDNCQPDP